MGSKQAELMQNYPSLDEISFARKQIEPFILQTPVWRYPELRLSSHLEKTEVICKLELLQKTGSFKPRGALLSILNIPEDQRRYGIVAASAGNHAIAVAYAAKTLGVSAKVVVPRTASQIRQMLCRELGAEIILTDNITQAFAEVEEIHAQESRTIIHPYEGKSVALGTATLGLELCEQIPELDAIIIPVGGGGLCGGIACAVKQLQPNCKIYGVEPSGANSMQQSFVAGKPQVLKKVETIADSLAIPRILPYSFSLCYRFVDEIVLVSDNDLSDAMANYFYHLKLAVEPAGAASLAALYGPLQKLRNKKVALIISGSNIDTSKFCGYTTSK